jgi:hypothetical protein
MCVVGEPGTDVEGHDEIKCPIVRHSSYHTGVVVGVAAEAAPHPRETREGGHYQQTHFESTGYNCYGTGK